MKFDAVLIAGATTTGKSRAALDLAHEIGGVVINADSMQVYREARILTARPTDEDTATAPHLLYGHVSAWEAYSAGRYQTDAGHALKEARSAGRIPVFTGGTGLYFDVLLNGLAEIPAIPLPIRRAAYEHRAAVGVEQFFAEMAMRDPQIADELRPSDSQRVLRAYEVLEATGQPLRYWQAQTGEPLLAGMNLAKFVLELPRDVLRDRIEKRFAAMLEAGAMEEALALRDVDALLPAAKIIGRRELIAVHDEKLTMTGATNLAVTSTRQFAKRQETWFRGRMGDWQRLDAQQPMSNIVSQMRDFVAE